MLQEGQQYTDIIGRTWTAVNEVERTYRGVLQLVEEVLAMLSAPELA